MLHYAYMLVITNVPTYAQSLPCILKIRISDRDDLKLPGKVLKYRTFDRITIPLIKYLDSNRSHQISDHFVFCCNLSKLQSTDTIKMTSVKSIF